MNEKIRKDKITRSLNLDKLPSSLAKISINDLGSLISEFFHYVFAQRIKSNSLNWCFANIKRIKIFFQIFHSNQLGLEIYKEKKKKNLPEYSYKTIAKIVDEGLSKEHFVLLAPDKAISKDAKVKNIRPSEELITDFLNLSIEVIAYIGNKKKPK